MLLFPSPYVAAVGGGSTASIAQNISGGSIAPGTSTTNWESSSITIGSGTNRVLVAVVAFETNTASNDLSSTAVTFGTASRSFGTGTSMPIKLQTASGARPRILFAVLAAPSTGAGTVQVTFGPANAYGLICRLFELVDADQTHTNYLNNGTSSNTSSVTTLAPSIGSVTANSVLLSALSIQGGDYSGEIGISAGTLNVAFSGTNAFSDCSTGHGSETGSGSGTIARTFSWTTSRPASAGMIAIPSA